MFKVKYKVGDWHTSHGYEIMYKKWYWLTWRSTNDFWSNKKHAHMYVEDMKQ